MVSNEWTTFTTTLTNSTSSSQSVSITFTPAKRLWLDEVNAIGRIAGDTNMDGSVNISDVTTLVDYILNKNPNPCDANACDVNNDGMVNIADVTALVDIILQK